MTIIPQKVNRKGHEYYELVDVKWVNGRTVHKYVGYLGKDLSSKREIAFGEILPYVTRLMDLEISDSGMRDVLKKIGIDTDITPITKIVLENDRKLKKTFLRIK